MFLPRNATPGSVREGFKRQKTAQLHPILHSLAHSPERALTYEPHRSIAKLTNAQSEQVSPRIPLKRRRQRKFKVPPGFSVTSLPTPVASSEIKPRASRGLQFDSESEREQLYGNSDSPGSPPRPKQTTFNAITVSSAESSSDDELVEEVPSRWKKKIRGVLPASWLRLDKQAKKPKPSVAHESNEHTDLRSAQTSQRGVARKVNRDRGQSWNRTRAQAVSSTSL